MNRKQRRAAAKLGSPPTQLLATALRLHQAGQLVAAEACYRQVLAAQPNLAEGHFNLGGALAGLGKLDEAGAPCWRGDGTKTPFPGGPCHTRRAPGGRRQAPWDGCPSPRGRATPAP